MSISCDVHSYSQMGSKIGAAKDSELSTLSAQSRDEENKPAASATNIAGQDSASLRRKASIKSQRSSQSTEPEQVLSQQELDEKPWKFIGYPGYSAYLSSETDFLIFRRFRTASTRIMLYLQDKVSVIEEELEKIDKRQQKRECEDVNNGTFRDDDVAGREKKLDELQAALEEYNAFILRQSQLNKLAQAPKHDIRSIQNWHYNHNDIAINANEQAYLTRSHDLFSLLPREKPPLRRLLERSKAFRLLRIWRKQTSDPTLPLYDKKEVTHISDKRIDKFVSVIMAAVGLAMLIGPIWILNGLQGRRQKLSTITGFIVLFFGIVGGATVAKIWEALAATAAYSAVLMVFMQLGTAGTG